MMTEHLAYRIGQEEAIRKIKEIGYDAVDISYFIAYFFQVFGVG